MLYTEVGDVVESEEADAGTFIVRSLRHGRRKALRKGQELMVNYNVPHYSPLDWFVSMGFVPPERQKRWQKIDPALPRIRRDAHGSGAADEGQPFSSVPSPKQWKETYGPRILRELKEMQQQQPGQQPKRDDEDEEEPDDDDALDSQSDSGDDDDDNVDDDDAMHSEL